MDIQSIEKIGELLCEGIHTLKKMGISNPILDKADETCSAILPNLTTLSLSDSAKLAEAAYHALMKVKNSLSS